MADSFKDDYFDDKDPTKLKLAFVKGQINVIEDLIGLPEILRKYKIQERP